MKKILLNISRVALISFVATIVHASYNINIDNDDDRVNTKFSFNIFYQPVIEHTTTDVNVDSTTAYQLTHSNNNETDKLSELPDEIKLHICKELSFKDIGKLGKVNRCWNRISEDRALWIKFSQSFNPLINNNISNFHLHIIKSVLKDNFDFTIHDDFYGCKRESKSWSANRVMYTGAVIDNGHYQTYIMNDLNIKWLLNRLDDVIESRPHTINVHGNIVVGKAIKCDCEIGFSWTMYKGMKLLPSSEGYFHKSTYVINNDGKVIGGCSRDQTSVYTNAAIWIDSDYHYKIIDFMSLKRSSVLKNIQLIDIYKLSFDGTAIFGFHKVLNKSNHYSYWSIVFPKYEGL